jgi:hypothetical protein
MVRVFQWDDESARSSFPMRGYSAADDWMPLLRDPRHCEQHQRNSPNVGHHPEEMHRALVPGYLCGARTVILVYDVTDHNSFQSLSYWHEILVALWPQGSRSSS